MAQLQNTTPSPRTGTPPPVQTPSIRRKIGLANTKFKIPDLVKLGEQYLSEIDSAKPEDKKVPTMAGFCLVAGISRSRLWELSQNSPEISDLLEQINMRQEQLALEGGLTNKTNPVFSIFLLKSKHGYQDQSPTLSQTNNFNISPDLLADALALMKTNSKQTK